MAGISIRIVGLILMLVIFRSEKVSSGESYPPFSGGIDSADAGFLREAIIYNRMEIQLAMMASRKAESEPVKAFAEQMLQYHNGLNGRLRQAAKGFKVELKDELDGKCKDEIDKLSRFKGRLFEKKYIDLSEENHKKTLELYRTTAAKPANDKVESLVASVIPFLEKHSASLRLLDRSIKETSKL